MFKPNLLRKLITFFSGIVLGGIFASVAVLGLASLLDANIDVDTTSSSLTEFIEASSDPELGNDLRARFKKILDTTATSTQPKSRFTRNTTLYSILVRSDLKFLEEFFVDSQNLSNSIWRLEVQSAILKRLTTIDSTKALDLATQIPVEQRQELLESIFREWSLLNLDDAVGAGSLLDFPDREIALKAIVQARADLPEEKLRAIGQRFGSEKYASRLIEMSRAMELVDTPHLAWEAMVGDGLDIRFRLDSAVELAKTWVSKDGVGVLREILETNADTRGVSAFDLVIVRSVARENPEEVFRQAAIDPDPPFLLTEIASVWAETDPVNALSGVSSLDDASERYWLTREIMETWSEINPQELLERRAVLPIGLELPAISAAIGTIAKTDPLEAVRLIENLHAEGVDTSTVAESLVYVWSENDPDATLDWVLSGSNDQNPLFGRMVEIAISRLARVDPERAMEMALNPHSSTWPEWMDYKVIDEIARMNVDTALKLLPLVSEGSRAKSYRKVGFEYVESGNPERAVELGEQLSPSERNSYYLATFDTWALTDLGQLLGAIEHFSSTNVQALAARALIRRNEDRHFLSNKQVKQLKVYLSEEDVEKL